MSSSLARLASPTPRGGACGLDVGRHESLHVLVGHERGLHVEVEDLPKALPRVDGPQVAVLRAFVRSFVSSCIR